MYALSFVGKNSNNKEYLNKIDFVRNKCYFVYSARIQTLGHQHQWNACNITRNVSMSVNYLISAIYFAIRRVDHLNTLHNHVYEITLDLPRSECL